MATVFATRESQYPLVAVFDIDMANAMKNTSGVLTNFKATDGVFDAILLPNNSIVIGGDITVVEASNDSGTATVKVGDATSDARYLAATTIKSTGRTALTLTGYENKSGENLRITLANQNGDATLGKVRVTVQYVIRGRSNELQTH